MKNIKTITLLFIPIFTLLFANCGLDTSYYISISTVHNNNLDITKTYGDAYYDFAVNYSGSSSDFTYQGIDLYYRIFNNVSAMNTVYNYVDKIINTSDSDKSTASTYLINSQGFKSLNIGDESIADKTKDISGEINFYIRLTNRNEIDDETDTVESEKLPAVVYINKDINNKYVPRRYGSDNYTFDFGRAGKTKYQDKNTLINYNVLPESGDSDYTCSSSFTEENKYYVAIYAIASGRDNSYQTYYSNPLYIGAYLIDADEENN